MDNSNLDERQKVAPQEVAEGVTVGQTRLMEATETSLLLLSGAKYQRWLQKESIPERNRLLRQLKTQNLSTAGRAHFAFEIYEDLSARGVRKRIDFYKRVVLASGRAEMFSKLRLEAFRQLIVSTVAYEATGLRDHIARDASAAGDLSPSVLQALLDERLYDQYRARVLNIVNAELRVLEAEGNVPAAFRAAVGRASQPQAGAVAQHAVEKIGGGEPANAVNPEGEAGLERTFDHLTDNASQSHLAESRFKKVVSRIGPVAGGLLQKIVETVATEAAKKSIGL
jgi:hypothetical protein